METNLEEQKHELRSVSGLGGWLVLIQILLYFYMVVYLVQFLNMSLDFISGRWYPLTEKLSEFYHPLWGTILIYNLVFRIIFLLFIIFILIKFYGKKRIFPRLIIIFYIVCVTIDIIGFTLNSQIYTPTGESYIQLFVRTMISSGIWIPYFMKSRRVRNTFIR